MASPPVLPLYGTTQPKKKKVVRKPAKPLARQGSTGVLAPTPKPVGVFKGTPPSTGVLAKGIKKATKENAQKDDRVRQLKAIKKPTEAQFRELQGLLGNKDYVIAHPKPALETAPLPVKLLANAAKDYIDINANAIPSMYKIGKDAVTGHPGEAGKELAQPYIDFAKHPAKSLEEHPLGSALLIAGVRGAVGHGAGKALRTAPSEMLRRIGSTDRPAATRVVPGTDLTEARPYSKDVTIKAAQVVKDKITPPERIMTARQIKRRADETSAAVEDIRRLDRGQAVSDAKRAVSRVPGKKGTKRVKPSSATVVAAQNIAKPGADMEAYLAEAEAAGHSLTHSEKAANTRTAKDLREGVKTNPEDTAAAARQYADLSVKQQDEMVARGLIPKDQADKARLIPYAVRKMAASVDPKKGLVDGHGHPVSTEDIRAHMQANGVSEPAFLTHKANQRGAKNFYVSSGKPPQVITRPRTGEAMRKGTMDVHPDTLIEQSAKNQGLISAAKGYAASVAEVAVRGKSGKVAQYPSYDRALRVAEKMHFNADGTPNLYSVPMVPVRLNPFLGRSEQLKALIEDANAGHEAALGHVHETIDQALSGHRPEGDGKGEWALIPKASADRYREHIAASAPSPMGALGNLYGGIFRKNVLAFSPKWLTGNVAEAGFRAAVAHAGPRSFLVDHRLRKLLATEDKKNGTSFLQQYDVRVRGGGHMSLNARSTVHTPLERFVDKPLLHGIGRALIAISKTPGPKQLVGLYRLYTHAVFELVNAPLERAFQGAMAGKAIRTGPLMSDHVIKLSTQALEEASRGLKDTNAMVQLGREVDRMYGKYGKFTPGQRRFIAAYTPFLAWTMNATKFLTSVLPQDHPVLASLVASSSQATEDWRKSAGEFMDPFGNTPGVLPDFLQGSIPSGGGSHIRASRYVPFGLVGGGVESLADLVLPQGSGVLAAFKGEDWKGTPLNGFHGAAASQAQRVEAAVSSLFGGLIPAYNVVGQARKGTIVNYVNPLAKTKGRSVGKTQTVTSPVSSPGGLKPLPALPALKPLPALPALP